jgi:mannitol/fructose-specific phosphotransferase system IIA component
MDVLTRETVLLGGHAVDKMDAITQSGETLVRAGYVAPSYVDGMLARERVMSTYLGNGIAIPHGQLDDLQSVYRTGVSVLQLPEGVEWEPGEKAYLVVGLAATPTSQEHLVVLTNLLEVLQDPEGTRQLVQAADPTIIVERLTRSGSEQGSEQGSETRWN